jgi:RNA polymerase sigma-70 factor (ECF subfamily)
VLTVDEAAVLAQARSGNRDAFRSIVERHSRAVFRVAFRLTRSEQDAEDIVQETFLKAYQELGRFEARAGVGTWLYRIAANAAIDFMRRRPVCVQRARDASSDAVLAGLPSQMPGPERQAIGGELRSLVESALTALTPLERAAFTLRHLEQRSVNEIAELLDQSPAATRHSIFRAVAKVRRALGPALRVSS